MGDTLHSIAIKSRGFLSFSNHGIWVPTPLDILKCHGLKNTKTSQTESKDRFPQLLLQRFALLPQFGRRRRCCPSDLGEGFRASEGWLQGTSAGTNGMVEQKLRNVLVYPPVIRANIHGLASQTMPLRSKTAGIPMATFG